MRMQNFKRARRVWRVAFVLAGGFLLIPAGAQAGFIFQDIVNSGDPNFNQELAINSAGVIAGYFGDGTIVPNNGYTVVPPYGQANFTAENFPGSVQTQVTGINNAGDTVGFWIDNTGANHGFTDIGNVFTSVDNPNSNSSPIFTQFLGVNASDQVAGFYNDAMGNSHAFVYAGGVFTAVNPASATSATAASINNTGEVAGFLTSSVNGDTYGFLDVSNTIQTFLFPGSTFTQFLGINNLGQVVGDYIDSAGNMHGLVYNSASNTWQSVDDPFGIGTTTINGINDQGQIVGFYVNANKQTIGMIGNPTPEPGSLALAGLSALLIGWRWRRQRS
jgi:uncharacterized membrane protein